MLAGRISPTLGWPDAVVGLLTITCLFIWLFPSLDTRFEDAWDKFAIERQQRANRIAYYIVGSVGIVVNTALTRRFLAVPRKNRKCASTPPSGST